MLSAAAATSSAKREQRERTAADVSRVQQLEKVMQLVAQQRVATTHAQAHVFLKKLMQLLFIASANLLWLAQH